MWVAIATTCVTSSMFLTGLAPNLLAIELVNKTAKVSLTWTQWFLAFAPVGIALLILIPLVTYWIYPPEVKAGDEVPQWAGEELAKMGGFTLREITLAALVVLALALWIFGGDMINATTVALVVISLMLLLGVVSWDDIVKNAAGVEHAGVVRDAGRAGRRAQPGRLRQMVRRSRRRAHDRVLAVRRDDPAGARVLLHALPVRQHHRARHRAAAGDAGGRRDDPRDRHGASSRCCSASRSASWAS